MSLLIKLCSLKHIIESGRDVSKTIEYSYGKISSDLRCRNFFFVKLAKEYHILQHTK